VAFGYDPRQYFNPFKLPVSQAGGREEMIKAGEKESALARPLRGCKMQASMYSFDKRHKNRPHYLNECIRAKGVDLFA